jgi:starch synthase
MIYSHDVSFVLGSGNKETEGRVREIVAAHPGQAGLRFDYDDRLAHRIEAGADIFLMPSKYEPCGLNQMYSMRYGTLPVVRATGGLADTVEEFDPVTGKGTGFRLARSVHSEAVLRALRYWNDKSMWRRIMMNGMEADFSWAKSARQYAAVYRRRETCQ